MDQTRRDWDKKFTTVNGRELKRDMMMENYMRKKKMIKEVRNDQDDNDEYETNYIITSDEESNYGKYIMAAVILALVLFCVLNRKPVAVV